MIDFLAIVRADVSVDVPAPEVDAEELERELRKAVVKISNGFYDYNPALVIEDFRVEAGEEGIQAHFTGRMLGALILAFLMRTLFDPENVEATFTDAESGEPVELAPGFLAGGDFKFFFDYLRLNRFPGHYYHQDAVADIMAGLVERYGKPRTYGRSEVSIVGPDMVLP